MKRIFCLSIFVASLMLAAPAQAETWSCSYVVDLLDGKKTSYSWIFVRDGAGFRAIAHSGDQRKYDVIMENEDAIHLYRPSHPKRSNGNLFVIGLFKKGKKFSSIQMDNLTTFVYTNVRKGDCVIH